MKKFLLVTCSLLIAVVTLVCQPLWQSVGHPMIKPGDKIGGMVITTGVANAPPLWAFCSPALENDGVMIADCQVPMLSHLAIGHPFEGTAQTLQALDWLALTWELYLDGQPLDLEAFGIYRYVMPGLAARPSPIREVFRQMKAWDVVLTNPTPGLHRLYGIANAGVDTYTWIVNFSIEAPLVR